MKKVFSTLFFGLIVVAAQAQDEVFKVLASRGSITTADKSSITAGKKLYKDDVVEVGSSAFVGLVHKSGKTLELRAAGSYPVSELAAKVGTSGSSVSERYANYVIQEVSKDKESSVKKNHQQYMAVTGAVTREAKVLTPEVEVKALVPSMTELNATQNATFYWHKVPNVKTYVVTVTNLGEEVLFQKETTDTTLTIDFAKVPVGKAKMCLWNVTAKGHNNKDHKSDKHGLQIIPTAKVETINKDLTALKADIDPKSSLSKIMLAAFYEDNHMYVDALHAYQEALKIEKNADYEAMYHNFLYRAGLTDKPASR